MPAKKQVKEGLDLERLLTIAVGALTMTREKAEEIVKKLEEKGEIKKKDSKKYIDELIKKGEKEREELTNTIDERIREITKKLGIVTKADIERIEAKLAKLEKNK